MNELDRAAIAWLTESDNDDTRALRAHIMEMLATRDAEIERLKSVTAALVDFQATYEKNTIGEKMPGNKYYADKLMQIVVDAREVLEAR